MAVLLNMESPGVKERYSTIILAILIMASHVDVSIVIEESTLPTRYDVYELEDMDISKIPGRKIAQERPYIPPSDGEWQPVYGTNFKFSVYSAFLDRRKKEVVRIIAVINNPVVDVVCRLWLSGNRSTTVAARVQMMREHNSEEYNAAFVICSLEKYGLKAEDVVGADVSVVVLVASDQPISNLLRVLDTKPTNGLEEAFQDKIHVCVKPLHSKYDRVEWMVEWLELNRLLGVSHFYMYDKFKSERVDCVLKYYQANGIVTLLPWNLDVTSKTVRRDDHIAAFNDCLYRSMATASWLMVIDLDEVVFPRGTRTIQQKIIDLNKDKTEKPAVYLFRSAYFYHGWKNDKSSRVPLLTSRKTQRLLQPHLSGDNNKYAVRPHLAIELGKHAVRRLMKDFDVATVPSESVLLHHYREKCEFGFTSQCLKLPSFVDRTAHNWANSLWRRVQSKQDLINKFCLNVLRLDFGSAGELWGRFNFKTHSNLRTEESWRFSF